MIVLYKNGTQQENYITTNQSSCLTETLPRGKYIKLAHAEAEVSLCCSVAVLNRATSSQISKYHISVLLLVLSSHKGKTS